VEEKMTEFELTPGEVTFVKYGNPWARISDIAARLNVPPHEQGSPATVTALGADGKQYDVFDVVIAFLDRMDKQAIAFGDGSER
jgi:hypothetical protein